MKWLALIAELTLIFVSVGCQRGGFNNSELGVSMDLPKGWVQGEPKATGFHKTTMGDCFKDVEQSILTVDCICSSAIMFSNG